MAGQSGLSLLNSVAERIIVRWLQTQGASDVRAAGPSDGPGVDLVYTTGGAGRRAKVKADAYFGLDPAKASDRTISFYRQDQASYAMESIANAATRDPGWIASSVADELFYYFVAISQPDDVVGFLYNEQDDLFFKELEVERDELVIIPMKGVRIWFDQNSDRYVPRPVVSGASASWNRLIPRADLESGVAGVRRVGSIFPGSAGRD